MKTLPILLFALGICCIRPAVAQEPVTLTFSNLLEQESETPRLMAELQQIRAWEVLVTGKITGRLYTLQSIRCVDGKEQRSVPERPMPVKSDTLRLLFFAQTIQQDSARLLIRTPQYQTIIAPAIEGADDCILLETFPEKAQTTTDAIPVMAFAPGEKKSVTFNGQTGEHMSFCNVRDSHLHPSKWHERFKLKDYIYFELRFTDKEQ